MWKKVLLLFFLVLVILLSLSAIGKAILASDAPCGLTDYSCQVDYYRKKIADAQGQERSLSSQISIIDNQISLTRSQIDLTEQKIGRLTDDIASVSGKIDTIQSSLQHVSEVLANRIVATYIQGRTDPILYLLSAADFTDFFRRLEYLRLVQKHDEELMLQMSITKKNYNDQKDLFQDKKKQVEALSAQLKAYKQELDRQNQEKQALLVATQNDEARYQQLLAQAKAQLAAFQGFVLSRGGASILQNQTHCDSWGCYYNQRDANWGNMMLGSSGYSVASSGCLISSSAMIATYYKKSLTPKDIAADTAAFFDSTGFFWLDTTVNGIRITRTRVSVNTNSIDSELSAGRPVIVGLYWADGSPEHFIVLKSGSGGNYKMNDPYIENGNDIPFTSKYSVDVITEVETVRVN